jgi:hypothetical protein
LASQSQGIDLKFRSNAAIVSALVGAALLNRFTVVPATILGGLLGMVLYLTNFHGFVILFPWFAEARDWVSILVHAVFGAMHGCGCKVMSARRKLRTCAAVACSAARCSPWQE